jgi:hypothetical protein
VVTNAGPVAVITDIHANLPGDRRIHLVHGSPRKCGSVGKPKDADPRGAFAILSDCEAGAGVTIERVEYDAKAVADEVAAAGLPDELADKLVSAA